MKNVKTPHWKNVNFFVSYPFRWSGIWGSRGQRVSTRVNSCQRFFWFVPPRRRSLSLSTRRIAACRRSVGPAERSLASNSLARCCPVAERRRWLAFIRRSVVEACLSGARLKIVNEIVKQSIDHLEQCIECLSNRSVIVMRSMDSRTSFCVLGNRLFPFENLWVSFEHQWHALAIQFISIEVQILSLEIWML